MGQRILEELQLHQEMDTLAHWMAHYLAEKMEQAESASVGEAKESAKRECVELILRLWECRHSWPLSAPLKDVADRLDELLKPKPWYFNASKEADPYLELLHGLEDLGRQEYRLCLSGWIAGLNLDQERAYLQHHSEHLNENELRGIQYLVEFQDRMIGPEAQVEGEPCPNFDSLSRVEQAKLIRSRLRAVAKVRTKLLGRS